MPCAHMHPHMSTHLEAERDRDAQEQLQQLEEDLVMAVALRPGMRVPVIARK